MSFNNNSNFNKKANFTEVKFGENKPVLEVELNELQQIQNEARADIIRDTIPSGFTQLGEIDYNFSSKAENIIRMASESIAYVNGYRIVIPEGTLIHVANAPKDKIREDLVFLEVWKQEVTNNDKLPEFGGEGRPYVKNPIQDSRYPIETTRRIALKWRIRCVADVDFIAHKEGLRKTGENWDPYQCKGQGGNTSIENTTYEDGHYYYGQCGSISNLDLRYGGFRPMDTGLFVCGNGSDSAKRDLKTVDGYCYAIPMFKIKRFPKRGRANSFEYSKINPLVDGSKLNNLLKEDYVEKVQKVTLKGNTINNLVKEGGVSFVQSNVGYNVTSDSEKCTITRCNDSSLSWSYWYFNLKLSLLKPSTTYSFIVRVDISNQISTLNFNIIVGSSTNGLVGKTTPLQHIKDNIFMAVFTTRDFQPSDITNQVGYIQGVPNQLMSVMSIYHKALLIEGDWSKKEIPSFDVMGMQSMGETENNLIQVHNSILKEGTYDPSKPLVLNKLDVNHQLRFDNRINKGFRVTQQATDTGYNVTSILGRTYHNIAPKRLGGTQTGVKPSTVYTVFMFKNDLGNGQVNIAFRSSNGSSSDIAMWSSSETKTNTWFSKVITTPSDCVYVKFYNLGEVNNVSDIVMVEGDVSSLDPTTMRKRGLSSLGEDEDNVIRIETIGKNLFDPNNIEPGIFNTDSYIPEKPSFNGYRTKEPIKVKQGTTYTLSRYDNVPNDNIRVFFKKEGKVIDHKLLIGSTCSFVSLGDELLFHGVPLNPSLGKIQLEEGSSRTSFEEYKAHKQHIHLKEPLRSLAKGEVSDEIQGNRVIRRIGKVILDGSESYTMNSGYTTENTVAFFTRISDKKVGQENFITDRFVTRHGDPINEELCRVWGEQAHAVLYIRVKKSDLVTPDVSGLKTWLRDNNVTVYYELDKPVYETIYPYYDRDSVITYQLTEPLRRLPDGTADELVGNVLTRRVGEIYLDGKRGWYSYSNNSNETYSVFATKLPKYDYVLNNTTGPIECDWFRIGTVATEGSQIQVCGYSHSDFNEIRVTIKNSMFNTVNLDSFKAWINDNPIKVHLKLSESMVHDVILNETSEGNFTEKRIFDAKLYNEGHLVKLKDGVTDTIKGNNIIRNVSSIVIDDKCSIAIRNQGDNSTTISFSCTGSDIKEITMPNKKNTVASYLGYVQSAGISTDGIEDCGVGNSGEIWFEIKRSRLTSADVTGAKSWLKSNPIKVFFELKTPQTVPVTDGSKLMYTPSHKLNTYLGSLYIGKGLNHVYSTNGVVPSTEVEVETESKCFKGSMLIDNLMLKKSEQGTPNYVLKATGKNLVDLNKFRRPGEFEVRLLEISWTETPNKAYAYLTPGRHRGYIRCSSSSIKAWVGVRITDPMDNVIYTGHVDTQYDNSNHIDFTVKTEGLHLIALRPNSENADNHVLLEKLMVAKGDEPITIDTYAPYQTDGEIYETVPSYNIEDRRHIVSLTGFDYEKLLKDNFFKLIKGEL